VHASNQQCSKSAVDLRLAAEEPLAGAVGALAAMTLFSAALFSVEFCSFIFASHI
jgi:hypothetical protein